MIAALLLVATLDSLFFASPVVTGRLDYGLVEVSGIVASYQHKGIFWVHNDSGDGPVIYAVDSTGQRQCAYEFNNDVIRDGSDWEDITYGWQVNGADTSYSIYVGDIGDNHGDRKFVNIYRMHEGSKMKCVATTPIEPPRPFSCTRRSFVYPDGPRDAETLLFDPLSHDLFVLSKREQRNRLYRVPKERPRDASADRDAVVEELTPDTLEYIMDLPLFSSTGGDISHDGKEILIKTYTHVYSWTREPDESIATALARTPKAVTYVPEPQGEGICFNASASGYYTVSEIGHQGERASLFYYARTTEAPEQDLTITKNKKRPNEYTISYTTENEMPVALTVHNELMMTLKILVDGEEKAGAHTHSIDMSAAAPGTYVVVLRYGAYYNAIPFTISAPSAQTPTPSATSKRKSKRPSRK